MKDFSHPRISKHSALFFVVLSFALLPSAALGCTCFDSADSESQIDPGPYCVEECDDGLATALSDTNCSFGEPDCVFTDGYCVCTAAAATIDFSCSDICTIYGLYPTPAPTPTPSTPTTPSSNPRPLITPKLSIDIPTVKFTDTVVEGGTLKINFMADYIAGLYKWLIGVATLIAIVFIMIGGMQYALFQQKEGMKRIKNAVAGLVLLLSTYIILATINPRLVIMEMPELEMVQYTELVKDSGDGSGVITRDNLQSVGIQCAGSGDVGTIAKSFIGKTTYRMGAKGGNPPYSAESKKDKTGRPYKEYCPSGTICLDCSGFVALVADCAGLAAKNESGGTASIFASAQPITSCGNDWVTLEDRSKQTLTAGDLIGFKSGDWSESTSGHVWMYIGNGTLINSVGRGRDKGTAIITQTLKSACDKFPLRFVDR